MVLAAVLACLGSLATAQFQFEFDGDFSDFFGGGGGGGGGGGADNRLKSSDLSDDADLYEILGIDEDASEKDVKKAYRKMTMKYHPDRNQGNEEAAKKFREVAAAYEILGDSEKKILYDHGGMDLVKSGVPEEGGGGGLGVSLAACRRRFQLNAKRGKTVHMETKVDLEDIYAGKTASFQLQCIVCRGAVKEGKTKEKAIVRRCPNEVKMENGRWPPDLSSSNKKRCHHEKCKQELKDLELVITRCGGWCPGNVPHRSDQKLQIPGISS